MYYWEAFEVPFNSSSGSVKSSTGIGGTEQPIGKAMITIPMKNLNNIINVKFQIMINYIPSILR